MKRIGFLCNSLHPDIIFLLNRLNSRLKTEGYIIKAYSLVKFGNKSIEPNFDFEESSSRVRYLQIKFLIPESQTITLPLRLCLHYVFESDILIFMGAQSIPALFSAILGKLFSKPIIVVSQTMPPEYEIKRLKLIKFLKKIFLRQANIHIAQTPKTIETLIQVYGIKPENIIFAPFEGGKNFFEKIISINKLTKEEAREILNLPKDKLIFLFVGSVIYLKGVDILLKAFFHLSNNKKSFLLLVGSYNVNDSYYKDLINFIQKNNLNNIRFEGYKSSIDLIKYYQAADIFVLPSRKDVFPRVLIEAAMARLPIITTDVHSANNFLVVDGKNGYVIPPNDVESLTKAMYQIINNNFLRMGEESYKIVNKAINSEAEEIGFVEAIKKASFKR
jgi:glycosyltransferase involved in cell wall biosynthesis